jgi:phage terminase Nu1 subunit (DNA packaging protein)
LKNPVGRPFGNVAVGRPADPDRSRLIKAQAEKVEMANRVARQELVPAEEVQRLWFDTLRQLRARLLALPGRIEQSLGHLTARDVALIDREIRDCLAEIGKNNGEL